MLGLGLKSSLNIIVCLIFDNILHLILLLSSYNAMLVLALTNCKSLKSRICILYHGP